MNNRWNFDEKFLRTEIKKGKALLKSADCSPKDAINIMAMIKIFEGFLGKKSITLDIHREKIDKMIKDMNVCINNDISSVSLDEWRELKRVLECIPKIQFESINNKELPKDDDSVIKASLKFYRSLDLKVYEACKKILLSRYHLISFKKHLILKPYPNGFVFKCSHLNIPFISIDSQDDLKYMVTVHELRHAANYYLYGKKINSLLEELPSIYSELLFIDKINKKYNCNNLYNFRINNFCETMLYIIDYVKILERFNKCGRTLTRKNYVRVLGVSNNSELLRLYNDFMDLATINCYNYTVSTLIALSYRDGHYQGFDKQINEQMERILLGAEYKLNYTKLAERYIDHLQYAYSLLKK